MYILNTGMSDEFKALPVSTVTVAAAVELAEIAGSVQCALFTGTAQLPALFKKVLVAEPIAGPSVTVFLPLNLAKLPLVPDPVTLLVIVC